jgi:2,4-dienoyl-CoA reductase-like NADH-dependent reductase (Old Yellow Enzyme family)
VSHLFTPITVRSVTVRNRIWVAPMCQYSAVDGVPNDWHLVHLGSFARGGAGLVFTEATAVVPEGRISPEDAGLWNDEQQAAWRRIVDFVQGQGAAAGIQLAHAGRKASTYSGFTGRRGGVADADGGWRPVGPSAVPFPGLREDPEPLDVAGIRRVVTAFGDAAERAVAAGFDVIEVHMAHGYLLASFLSPISNTRNDEYGCDRNGRMRLPLEIVEAVRREMPATMPLFVRVSSVDGAQNGWNMDDTVALAHELKARGVDVVDCSSGGISGSATAAQVPRGLGFQVPYAERVRKEVDIATMAVGIILEAEQAEVVLEKGQADLIAVGRQSQYNPNIAHHWAHDLGINRKFEDWAPEYGWWLEKRIRTMEGFATPTGSVRR